MLIKNKKYLKSIFHLKMSIKKYLHVLSEFLDVLSSTFITNLNCHCKKFKLKENNFKVENSQIRITYKTLQFHSVPPGPRHITHPPIFMLPVEISRKIEGWACCATSGRSAPYKRSPSNFRRARSRTRSRPYVGPSGRRHRVKKRKKGGG